MYNMVHQGKSRWHSYHVLVYISISHVLTYLLGDCAMYFDHGVTGAIFSPPISGVKTSSAFRIHPWDLDSHNLDVPIGSEKSQRWGSFRVITARYHTCTVYVGYNPWIQPFTNITSWDIQATSHTTHQTKIYKKGLQHSDHQPWKCYRPPVIHRWFHRLDEDHPFPLFTPKSWAKILTRAARFQTLGWHSMIVIDW